MESLKLLRCGLLPGGGGGGSAAAVTEKHPCTALTVLAPLPVHRTRADDEVVLEISRLHSLCHFEARKQYRLHLDSSSVICNWQCLFDENIFKNISLDGVYVA